jgi:hypothetical protein
MIINASINLDKIQQDKIIPGKQGRYVNITIFTRDEKDQYGNDVSVQQKTEKDETKIYLGNGRITKK